MLGRKVVAEEVQKSSVMSQKTKLSLLLKHNVMHVKKHRITSMSSYVRQLESLKF